MMSRFNLIEGACASALLLLGAGPSGAAPSTSARVTPMTIGQTVSGALEEDDPATSRGHRIDSFTFSGTAGETLEVSLSSAQFDTHLRVTSPGGQSELNGDAAVGVTDSRLVMTLSESGVHTIDVTSALADATGSYELRVRRVQREESGPTAMPLGARPTQTAPPGLPAATTIQIGQSIQGMLEASDSTSSTGQHEDHYLFAGTTGQQVTLTLESSQTDPFLRVISPSGRTVEDDDSGGGTNALLGITLPESGMNRVVVTTFAAGRTGTYSLTLSPGRAPPSGGSAGGPGGGVRVGDRIQGDLTDSDGTLPTGERMDHLLLHPSQMGQGVEIVMTSDVIDSYLILRSPSGKQIDDDDSGPSWTDARIRASLDETGPYDLVATCYFEDERGPYQIEIRPYVMPPNGPGGPLALNEPWRGYLGPGDAQIENGEYCDEFTLSVERGQRLRLYMSSPDVSCYLVYVDPNGQQTDARQRWSDDDFDFLYLNRLLGITAPPEAETNISRAMLDVTAGASGTARIGATTSWEGVEGEYHLVVTEPNVGPGGMERFTGSAPIMVLGQTQRGRLAGGDVRLSSGSFGEAFSFMGRSGQEVTITLESSDFTPRLLVQAPGGQEVVESDGGICQTTIRLPSNGRYVMVCTSVETDGTGNYSLSIQ
jgi:hypothetical protein